MLLLVVLHFGTMPRLNQALIIRFQTSFYQIKLFNNNVCTNQPRVLMTEEELSISPCKWTQYMNDKGQIYYSDGVTSR